MKRRDFLKTSIGGGLAAGAALKMGGFDKLWSSTKPALQNMTWLPLWVVILMPCLIWLYRNWEEWAHLFKKGQKVLIKPNIGWDVIPELAANTNPLLVKRIIEHCFKAGAKEVYVFDHTCDNWVNCYSNSGIEKAAKSAGAKVVPGNSESYYHEIEIPGGIKLQKAKVHQLLLETDVFINVPVLKGS